MQANSSDVIFEPLRFRNLTVRRGRASFTASHAPRPIASRISGGCLEAPAADHGHAHSLLELVRVGEVIANPDLPKMFAAGLDRPPKPCTFANKCLTNFPLHPIGCYDESRFASREEMIRGAMAIFEPPAMVPVEGEH